MFDVIRSSRLQSGIRRALAGLIVVTAAGWGVTSFAHGHGGPHAVGHPGMTDMMAGPPEKMARRVDRLLDSVEATEAQRAQIREIVLAAAVDLKAQRDAGRALHEQGLQLFAAPAIDAAAIETMRQQGMAQHDAVTRRITQALIDFTRVLTPEQRHRLAERMKHHGNRMHQGGPRMQPPESWPQKDTAQP